jgi:hypothetical protein
MDTILIIRDSVATCVKGTADICQPYVKTGLTGISWQEVIVLAVILLFAFFVLWLLCKYQIITRKNTNKKGNGENNEDKRKEEQLARLKDRLYSQLQARVYIDKFDASGRKIKEYSKENDEEYIKRLEIDIEGLDPKFKRTAITETEE